MLIDAVTCPGCGVALPPLGWADDGRQNASPECLMVCGEIVAFAFDHPPAGRLHQLVVDAYGAQHAGPPTPPIRVAYSLVGLLLTLEQGWTGPEVRDLHQRMGRPTDDWPAFPAPASRGRLTVVDVVERGARADDVVRHETAVWEWAAEVWSAWADQHAVVAAFANHVVSVRDRR